MKGNLEKIKFFMMDMDGTIYLGDNLIDGALDFIKYLNENNYKFIFMTNNSSKNAKAYVEKLAQKGIHVNENKIFTSGEATAIYLKKQNKGNKIFLLGNQFLRSTFINYGFEIIDNRSITPDYVVLGFDTTITYEKIWIACDFIREGVAYIATHPDLNCPLADGKWMPDVGSFIEVVKASTVREPDVIVGKPNKFIVDAVAEKYNIDKEGIVMIGDRVYTDIKLGQNANVTSVLVLSGETSLEQYNSQNEVKADLVIDSVKELIKILNKNNKLIS